MIAEGKEGNKMFSGGIEMLSVRVIKNLYCYGITLVYCRYIGCSEVGFSQLNRAAETEIMIPFFSTVCLVNSLPGVYISCEPKAKRHQRF